MQGDRYFLEGMGFKPAMSDWLLPPASIYESSHAITFIQYLYVVRVAMFKQQKAGAFYLNEQDVWTGRIRPFVPQDRLDSFY